MKVGLFLDVDGVLVREPVNIQVARWLGVEDRQREIEARFAETWNNDELNQSMVPLFRRAKFTRKRAENFYKAIRAQQSETNVADSLLSLDVEKYLVSSGPDYFVHRLADQFHIPRERVKCSEYEFGADGRILRCKMPCNHECKAEFVRRHADKYDLRIGIGDTPKFDTFLQHCDIRCYVGTESRGHVGCIVLEPILHLVTSVLARQHTDVHRLPTDVRESIRDFGVRNASSKSVFVMTPFENDARFRELKSVIRDEFKKLGIKAWWADDVRMNRNLWENVQCYMHGCTMGLAILIDERSRTIESGDRVAPRKSRPVFNPNVLLEAGYMHGLGKSVLVLKDKSVSESPTDLRGFIHDEFDLSAPKHRVRTILRQWISSGAK